MAASDWQIVKVGNREYLTVDNVAEVLRPADRRRAG